MSRFNFFLAVLVGATAIAHFFVVTDLSTKGFLFKDLKSRANELTDQRQSMEGAISTLGSYQSLSSRIQSLQLVAADNVQYLSWNQDVVAKK